MLGENRKLNSSFFSYTIAIDFTQLYPSSISLTEIGSSFNSCINFFGCVCVCVIFFASCMQLYDVVVANHVELLNQQPLLCHRLYGYAADHVYTTRRQTVVVLKLECGMHIFVLK